MSAIFDETSSLRCLHDSRRVKKSSRSSWRWRRPVKSKYLHDYSAVSYIQIVSQRLVEEKRACLLLRHPTLSWRKLRALTEAIKNSPYLEEVHIEECPEFSFKAITDLCSALVESNVRYLSITGIRITNPGLDAVTKMMQERSRASERPRMLGLRLDKCLSHIEEKTWERFVGAACRHLDFLAIPKNELSKAPIQALAKGISDPAVGCRLKALLVNGNPVGKEGLSSLFCSIETSPSIIAFSCAGCKASLKCRPTFLQRWCHTPSFNQKLIYSHRKVPFENYNGEWRYWKMENCEGNVSLLLNSTVSPVLIPRILARFSKDSSKLHDVVRSCSHVLSISERGVAVHPKAQDRSGFMIEI